MESGLWHRCLFCLPGRLLFYNVLYSKISLGSTECAAQHEDSARGRWQSPLTALSMHAASYRKLWLPLCSFSVVLGPVLECEHEQTMKVQGCPSAMNCGSWFSSQVYCWGSKHQTVWWKERLFLLPKLMRKTRGSLTCVGGRYQKDEHVMSDENSVHRLHLFLPAVNWNLLHVLLTELHTATYTFVGNYGIFFWQFSKFEFKFQIIVKCM